LRTGRSYLKLDWPNHHLDALDWLKHPKNFQAISRANFLEYKLSSCSWVPLFSLSKVTRAVRLDLGTDCKTLLFHTEVCWLSKGNMLSRLYELKDEVEIFLQKQKQDKLVKFVCAWGILGNQL
ncbi:hypothetical protein FHG87_017247, partial [Trinorchestia longiramus]